jgi:hypothetical protein
VSRDEDEPEPEEEVEVDDDVPILNVTDEDSPYALINNFFPDRVYFFIQFSSYIMK